jgi:hypothetical protein
MARIRLELDQQTFEKLIQIAVAERRPVVMQAEVILRRSLGLGFPYPEAGEAHMRGPAEPRRARPPTVMEET